MAIANTFHGALEFVPFGFEFIDSDFVLIVVVLQSYYVIFNIVDKCL